MKTYLQYWHVFGEGVNRELYRLARAKRELFARSKTSPSKHYPDWRKSTVIYDDQLPRVTARLEREIRARLPEVLAALHVSVFDIGSCEIQLTSHNDGEYYKWHTDNGSRDTENRVITFVYYFHSLPKRFSGGELVIHQPDGQQIAIEPQNDSLVFFSSRTKHEVKQVICPSRLFEDGRFTLNGWIRRKVVRRLDDYFDQRIFSPPTPTAQRSSSSRQSVRDTLASDTYTSGLHRATPAGNVLPTRADAPREQTLATVTSLLNLYSGLYRQSRRAGTIDVLTHISGSSFYDDYYYMNLPVFLKGLLATAEALQKWSPAFFSREYGSVPVEITAGRDKDPEYETHFCQTVQTMTMAEFVERLSVEGETNDFYLVARNYFFENPALRPLRRDLQPPPDIINTGDEGPGTIKLWFGPKGTVTPLHYDEHSILFTQIYGRKRFKLIPSFDYPKLYVRNTFYSAVDPERVDAERYPEFAEASVAEVIVEPGDVLFIPAGWWHWARSLDISISATFCSFHVPGRNTALAPR